MFNLVEFFGMEEGKLYLSAYCIKDNDHANYVGEAFAELVESNASNWEVGKSFGGLVNVQKMDKLIRAFQKGNINTVNKIKGEISESFFKFAYRVQKWFRGDLIALACLGCWGVTSLYKVPYKRGEFVEVCEFRNGCL